MVRLDHLAIPVRDHARSRDWYTTHFGFRVEFEVPERKTVALQDDGDLTLFLVERTDEPIAPSCTFSLQVDDVEVTYRELAARGLSFEKPPQKLFWGYGAELRDPDGYLIGLWDDRSMREKGGA
jgi:catechol 2,3-dioxygenase-like lactoylglutathione lyase family enzyme